jgi:Family of unknown function (DUF6502)
MNLAHDESVEQSVATLLDSLALVLISLNMTPARLAQIARASFVKAGATYSRKRSSGRPHLAKIAALTGLSRAEVKRIVSKNFEIGDAEIDSWPRALRVLNAWTHSRRYLSNGRPRRLRLTGVRDSFAELCKSHSGDIPPRVILSELERCGSISISADRNYVSVSSKGFCAARTKNAKALIEFAAQFISASLSDDLLLVKRRQRVSVPNSIPRAYVEDAITVRVNDLLDLVPRLFPNGKGRREKGVSVFALVARDPS